MDPPDVALHISPARTDSSCKDHNCPAEIVSHTPSTNQGHIALTRLCPPQDLGFLLSIMDHIFMLDL
jgi:hypothetical protein